MRFEWCGVLGVVRALVLVGCGTEVDEATDRGDQTQTQTQTQPQTFTRSRAARSGRWRSRRTALLFAANTPDNRLEIFRIAGRHLVPVALGAGRPRAGGGGARRGDDEVWVVNHLSDSVSIVDCP